MPLTPKAKHARTTAQRVAISDTPAAWSLAGLSRSELVSLAEEYIALFDDYEDRYRRAKVEALNEVIQELNDDLDSSRVGHGGFVTDCEGRLEDATELAERVRLRYLKEGGR